MVMLGKTMGNFAGKTEKKAQSRPIALLHVGEVGKLADPSFSFVPAVTVADNLGTANRVD